MEVLATGGDSLLGGDNWDEAMVAWAYQTIAEDSEELDTQRLRHQLRTAARNAKACAASMCRHHFCYPMLFAHSSTRIVGTPGAVFES